MKRSPLIRSSELSFLRPLFSTLLSLALLLALPSRAAADGISWTAKKPLPTPRAYLGAVVLQGKIWAVGGYSGSNLANLDVYDPVTDTWSAKAPMPTPRAMPVVAVVNGKIYAIGGVQLQSFTEGTIITVTEEYDPATDTWTRKTDIPFPAPTPSFRNTWVGGAAVGSKIEVAVFHVGHSSTYEYDPVADTWNTTKAPVPFTNSTFAAAGLAGKLYVAASGEAPWGGPYTSPLPFADFDPVANLWVVRTPAPTIRRAVGLGAFLGRIYAIGGAAIDHVEPEETFFRPLATVESFDTTTRQWTASTPMPTARLTPAVVAVNNRIYVLGGALKASNDSSDPIVPLDAVEAGDPAPPPGSCLPDGNTLCLDHEAGDGRFEIKVSFATTQGGGISGEAGAVPLAPLGIRRGGAFWFFSADNPELLVKVLDGCPLNQRFWVFASAGTNVGFTLHVRDLKTGHQYTYVNPDLTPAPAIQATTALTCP